MSYSNLVTHLGRFRELSEAELICVWGGVHRRNLMATLFEIEQYLTERHPTRLFQRPPGAPTLRCDLLTPTPGGRRLPIP